MKTTQYSINDIARDLGVSPSTVSRALKDHPDLSIETKRLVKDYARKVKYRPNVLALNLKNQRSQTIGLIIPEIKHSYFSSVISGIENFSYSRGYTLIICQTQESTEREIQNVQILTDNRVAGILISLSKDTLVDSHFRAVIDMDVPLVFFDRICKTINTDRIVTDDFQGAYLATKHLIDRGRRKILHLTSPSHLLIGEHRQGGYRKALQEAGIEFDPALMIECGNPGEVEELKDDILKLAPGIDGLFATNDTTAITVMQLLNENGFKIPEDIAVVGFGNDAISGVSCPSLTSIDQHGFDVGYRAAEILIRRLEDPHTYFEFETIVIPVVLVKRKSS